MDQLIRQAITSKRLIEFTYHGFLRVAEPHIYGQKGNSRQVLGYQVRGQSSKPADIPNWRRFDVAEISALRILDETFSGPRTTPSGMHTEWDQTFAIVS